MKDTSDVSQTNFKVLKRSWSTTGKKVKVVSRTGEGEQRRSTRR